MSKLITQRLIILTLSIVSLSTLLTFSYFNIGNEILILLSLFVTSIYSYVLVKEKELFLLEGNLVSLLSIVPIINVITAVSMFLFVVSLIFFNREQISFQNLKSIYKF